MSSLEQLVVFSLDERRYALRLSAVERVVRLVEVTPLPAAPEIVLGVINLEGRIVPVVDTRSRFRLPAKEQELSDHILIAHTARREVALLVDSVSNVVELSGGEVINSSGIVPGIEYVEGIAKLEDGMVLIHDLDRFLSLEEEKMLEEAIGPGVKSEQ